MKNNGWWFSEDRQYLHTRDQEVLVCFLGYSIEVNTIICPYNKAWHLVYAENWAITDIEGIIFYEDDEDYDYAWAADEARIPIATVREVMKSQVGQPCLFVKERIWYPHHVSSKDESGCIKFNAVSLKGSPENVVELQKIISEQNEE